MLTELFAWFHAEVAKLMALVSKHAIDGTVPPPIVPEVAPAVHDASTYRADGTTLADSNGCIGIQAIADAWADNPHLAKRFGIKDVYENPTHYGLTPSAREILSGNMGQALMHVAGAAVDQYSLDGRGLYTVFDNAQGAGDPVDGALCFPGDNMQYGVTKWVGPSLADIPQFIANCKAQYVAAVARGDTQADGYLPIIDHRSGIVAHQ